MALEGWPFVLPYPLPPAPVCECSQEHQAQAHHEQTLASGWHRVCIYCHCVIVEGKEHAADSRWQDSDE